MNTLPTNLIESALALTVTHLVSVCFILPLDRDSITEYHWRRFSIEKFYAYLLSPEFIEKYYR